MNSTDWIDKVIEDAVNGKQCKRRIQSGIDHLEGKKLYKYYSFSSNFTIPNLKNGTIYFQNPVLFNDPFDCNIGISVNQLISALMPDFFDRILPNTDPNIRDVLNSCLLGYTVPSLEEGSKEHLLSICSNSTAFNKMIEKARNGHNISNQEILSYVLEDPITSSAMIKAYLTTTTEGDTLSFDEMTAQQLIKAPQIIRGLLMNVAETREAQEKQLLECLTSKDDFFEKIESFASLVGGNIPKSEIEKVYSELDAGLKQIREKLGEIVGIECFTQSPTDVLMWSYYSDKHTGVCVEYDFSKLFSTCSDALLFPVSYSENRPLLDVQNLYDPISKQFCNNRMRELLPSVIKSLIIKSSEWEREKEWRLISFSIKSDSDRLIKLPIISRIITGINISDENYQIVSNIAKEKGVPIYRTRLKNDQYKILINDDN